MGYAIRNDGVYGWRSVDSAADCLDGETYSVAQPGPYEETSEGKAALIRAARDAKLTACEWRVTRHRDQVDAGAGTTLTNAQYQALLTYRQALRDITGQADFPNVVWPETPA